jgi:hypothetical protein
VRRAKGDANEVEAGESRAEDKVMRVWFFRVGHERTRALCSRLGAIFVLVLALIGLSGASASAVTSAPAWQVTDMAAPTVLTPAVGQIVHYDALAQNVGGAPSTEPVTVSISIPAGLKILHTIGEPEGGECLTTTNKVSCTDSSSVVPGGFVLANVELEVAGPVASVASTALVSGGGAAATASDQAHMRLSRSPGEHAPAGIAELRFDATGPAGEPVTRAGGHPDLLTTSLLLNNVLTESTNNVEYPVEAVKDLVFYLPVGLLGDVAAAKSCPAYDISHNNVTVCSASSRVGTIIPMVLGAVFVNDNNDPTWGHPIESVTPEKGFAAEFEFEDDNFLFTLYANVVWHDGRYVTEIVMPGLEADPGLVGFVASFFGNLEEHYLVQAEETKEISVYDGAFLTDPSDCGSGPQEREMSLEVHSWEGSEPPLSTSVPGFTAPEGCSELPFSSSLTAAPDGRVNGDTTAADEPSGYKLGVEVAQAASGALGVDTPPFRALDLTLPEGTSLAPGAANGLTACAAKGSEGINFPSGTGIPGAPGTQTGEGEEDGPDGLPLPVAGDCPSSSQVGVVRATTPLIDEQLEGHLYLAEPECGNTAHPDPCTPQDAADGSLYRLYLELEMPQRGVVIKLAGKALVNPATGRITSVFEGIPQFPVSNLTIETSGGPRASLANPQQCGTATTTDAVTPWSAPWTPTSSSSSSFEVTGCGSPSPFAPAFTAGTTMPLAGAYSPFTLALRREDREQNISAISSTLPAGLLAAVKNIAQCPEPQASEGACPASSQVGTTTVGVGSGPAPLYQSGQVYFTGPYGGASFGLSVVVPAVAGPFNLGDVIVRVALYINSSTTQVTAISSPFPQMIDGVPLRIRTVDVTLNDPAFTFNATNCSSLSITGAVSSTQGATAGLSSPYQAGGCADLPFKPVFSASTDAKASRAGGASLDVKIASKGGPQAGGGEANIRSVKVDLPRQLPSRLSTLQKACTEGQFAADPAGCPKESDVGTATATTPLLAHPLAGPAYLVSHGGKAYPDLEIILQGEGVVLVLDGNTDIKKDITSSTFNAVPDAPISSFELKLPTGKFSVLTASLPEKAKYDFCGQSLSMPTEITGQNGAVIKETTKIAVTGCPKAKQAVKKKKRTAKKTSKASDAHGNGRKRS